MKPEQRDIVLIPVPFTDLKSKKKRPVLVLSKSSYNSHCRDILVAAITSSIPANEYFETLAAEDMEKGALKLTSYIRADKIFSLSQDIIIKTFGKVKVSKFKQVLKKISLLTEHG